MILAVYNEDTGYIVRSIEIPSFMLDSVLINSGQALIEIPRFAKNKTEYIKNGVLTKLLPINNPELPFDDVSVWSAELGQWVDSPELSAYKHLENQSLMWERIKSKRLQAVTSGVYVASIDKTFHTDELSATTYATIAGMIALNNYEPLMWKTMDNTWLLLTIEIFKELQTAMSAKTNANYAIAEQHKAAMLLVDDPLEYDYSDNWL